MNSTIPPWRGAALRREGAFGFLNVYSEKEKEIYIKR